MSAVSEILDRALASLSRAQQADRPMLRMADANLAAARVAGAVLASRRPVAHVRPTETLYGAVSRVAPEYGTLAIYFEGRLRRHPVQQPVTWEMADEVLYAAGAFYAAVQRDLGS